MVNKPHLVNWYVVYLDKQKESLDFRNLLTYNKALPEKWSWRFVTKNNPLWKLVIVGKHKQDDGGWCTKEVIESYGVRVWKAIRNG